MNMEYYVYQARGLNGVLLYIGQGCGHRYRHCNSGISSCLELNRYFFEHGADAIKVNILSYFLTKEEALLYEKSCIKKLKPLFNKDFNIIHKSHKNLTDFEKMSLGLVVDYSRLMKMYIKALDFDDTNTIAIIEEKSPIHKHHMEIAGKDRILGLSCNKTKVTRLVRDLERFDNNYYSIVAKLSLKVGVKYTRKEIKNKLQKVYDDLGITQTANATDIEKYFSVRDCYVERVNRGYEIIGKV